MRAKCIAIITAILVANALYLQMATADDEPDPASEARANEVIQGKLKRLHKRLEKQDGGRTLAPSTRSKGLGFDSVAQVGEAKPDAKGRFRLYYVALDRLRAYKNGDDPWPLLEKTNSFIYPIVAPDQNKKDQVRSAAVVDVELDDKNSEINQQLSQLGTDASTSIPIQEWVEARKSLMQELHTEKCRCFIIAIPALGTGFIGTRTPESFQIKVMSNGPGKLKKGVLLHAKDVFEELSKEAQNKRYDAPEEPDIRPLH